MNTYMGICQRNLHLVGWIASILALWPRAELVGQPVELGTRPGIDRVDSAPSTTSVLQGRWSQGSRHGGVFLHIDGPIDIVAPTPESRGFLLLVSGSEGRLRVLRVVGGDPSVVVVNRSGFWSGVEDQDRAWIEPMLGPMAQKLGTRVAALTFEGRPVLSVGDGEVRWAGSVQATPPALSIDSERGVVQAGWTEAGFTHGIYGIVKDPPIREGRGPSSRDDFEAFVGFRWNPGTSILEVLLLGAPESANDVARSELEKELEATLIKGVAELMNRGGSEQTPPAAL